MTLRCLALLLLLPASAWAQQGALQLEQFEPQPSSAGILNQPTSGVIPGGDLALEFWGGYQRRPLSLRSPDGSESLFPVQDRLSGELLAGYGLLDVADISIAVPWSGSPTGGDVAFARRTPDQLSAAALGDLRLSVHGDLMNALLGGRGRSGDLGVGIGGTLWLPTGSVESLTGERLVRGEARVALDWTAPFGLRIGGNVGVQFRPESHLRQDVYNGDRLRWGADLSVPLGPLPVEALAVVYGAVFLDPREVAASSSPAEVLGGLRFRAPFGLHGQIAGGAGLSSAVGVPEGRIVASLGWDLSLRPKAKPLTGDPDHDGILDADDRCPREPETINGLRDEDGCPETDLLGPDFSTADPGSDAGPDYRPSALAHLPPLRRPDWQAPRDGDSIPSRFDLCPSQDEDVDGFEDQDGCPDPDNDRDGVLDVDDRCPLLAETPDGRADDDGCPDGAVREEPQPPSEGPDTDGDGVVDAADRCPLEPETRNGVRDADGCPEAEATPAQRALLGGGAPLSERLPLDTDADGDGVVSSADRCPDAPEDRDGFEDQDGCPDPDNDADGVPDRFDRCPLEAENRNGVLDEDGCPDRGPDEDGDLVDDAEDRCPREPENRDGARDEDGCPESWWVGLPSPVGSEPSPPGRSGHPHAPGAPADVALLPPLGRGGDPDHDGLDEREDLCPLQAEDIDGFLDGDGCPDPDNDGDGVPDAEDRCPLEAESPDGFEDEDGCPDRVPEALVEVAGIVRGIRFRTGSSRLLGGSYATLKQVLVGLREDLTLHLLVAGHTDDEGDHDRNVALSLRRAEAVVSYLRRKGIGADRLEVRGFGPDRPIAPNDHEEGRAANRRVELSYTHKEDAP